MFLFIYFFCSNIGTDHVLYTEEDLEKSMEKIEMIDFHEVMPVYYLRFKCDLQNMGLTAKRSEWCQVLVLPGWSCAWSGNVHD